MRTVTPNAHFYSSAPKRHLEKLPGLSKIQTLSGSFMHTTELSKGGHRWHLNCAALALRCSTPASRTQHAIMRPERLLKYTRCRGFQQLFLWSLRQRLFRDRTAPLGNYIPRATRCLSNSPPSKSQASFCGSLWNKYVILKDENITSCSSYEPERYQVTTIKKHKMLLPDCIWETGDFPITHRPWSTRMSN